MQRPGGGAYVQKTSSESKPDIGIPVAMKILNRWHSHENYKMENPGALLFWRGIIQAFEDLNGIFRSQVRHAFEIAVIIH